LPQDCTVYTLRHTHASHALMNGMNLQLLAENMGTSVKQIEETYGRFTKEKRRQLIEEHGFKLGLKPGNVKALGAAE
jgi:site-specific recombinase XerD